MANLQEMLQGVHVEWKKLGEVCIFRKGDAITRKKAVQGDVPVIAGGAKPAYYHNKSNRDGETIVVAASGTAGLVSYWNVPIFVSDAFSVEPNEELNLRYLYHWLLNNQENIYQLKRGGVVPHVYAKDLAHLAIPIPPIEVQSEIAHILDTFTELSDMLSTELILRKKQYAYYLEKLLSEEGLKKCARMLGEDEKLSFYKLKEIFNIRNGYTPSKSKKEYWENGTIPWFRMEDIRTCGNILDDSILHVSQSAIKGSLFKKDSIILSTSATIGEHALIRVPFLANQRFTSFSIKDEFFRDLNIKYTFYYFYLLDEWCKKNVKIGHFASVDMDNLILQVIPIPPPKVQAYVVGVLDKFSALIAETEGALPAEIAMRKKQYEYYRDALLKFEK